MQLYSKKLMICFEGDFEGALFGMPKIKVLINLELMDGKN
jgi:hypothetical protein